MGHRKRQKDIECRYFPKNRCTFGSNCKFSHNMQSNRSRNNPIRTFGQRVKQCKFYENCQRFPNCDFQHNEICEFQEQCRKRHCNYVHLKNDFLRQAFQKATRI